MKTKGWKNIFSFTFAQQIKTKSFIISTVIIATIVALIVATANILPVFLLEDEISQIESLANGEMAEYSVSKLYLDDETELNANFAITAVTYGFTIEKIRADEFDAKLSELETTSENAMLVRVYLNDGLYGLDGYYAGENSTVNSTDCTMVLSTLATQLQMQYLDTLNISTDQMTTVMSGVSTSLLKAGKEATSVGEEVINAVVPMISSIVLFIFIFAYSQLVAQAIAIEKSSRVMEYLLTSVSPLSIIIGKILAICLVSLMQFLILICSGVLGFFISSPFGIFSKIDGLLAAAADSSVGTDIQQILTDIQNAFSTFSADTIVVMILTFVLGFLFYALIAGLAGASISKMEDLSAAIQPMSFIGVLGFYLAYMPQIGAIDGETNAFMIVARYLPVSSPFCLPSAYMLGQMSLGEACISLLVLLASVIVLCLVVAKVYEHIVLHTGDRLKLADMLKIAKTN